MCSRRDQAAPEEFSLVFTGTGTGPGHRAAPSCRRRCLPEPELVRALLRPRLRLRLSMAIDYTHQLPADSDRDRDRDRDTELAGMPHEYEHDDGGSESDTSEGIVELEADEIPGYFQERGGRLFHSHGSCPYPLPVDAEEQQVSQPGVSRAHVTVRPGTLMAFVVWCGVRQRQNGLHQLLRRLIGDLAVGPVRDVLTALPGEQRRVLDLGTGTGSWYVICPALPSRRRAHAAFAGCSIWPATSRTCASTASTSVRVPRRWVSRRWLAC